MDSEGISTNFICNLFTPFNGDEGLNLGFRATNFEEADLNPSGLAATSFIPGNNSNLIIKINSSTCETSSSLDIFETLQHELIHADLKRRLLQEYGYVPSPGESFQDAFDQLVLETYGGAASQDEHLIMVTEYLDIAVNSLIEMNGGVGTYNDFVGIVLNGFPLDILEAAGYTEEGVTAIILNSFEFINDPENIINETLLGCD